MKYLVISFSIVFVILVCVSFIKKNNTRWFIKGNIKVWANLAKIGSKNYYVVEIGKSDRPFYKSHPNFCFKIGNDYMIETKSMTIDFLESIADRRGFVDKNDEQWPSDSILLYIGPYNIIHKDGKVLYYKAEGFTNSKDDNSLAPVIGSKLCDEFYKFPLSEREIIELFGEPDKVIDFYRN